MRFDFPVQNFHSFKATLRRARIAIGWVTVWLALSQLAIVPTMAAEDYLLGPGDSVKIAVFYHSDLDTEARISASGSINFPLLGEIVIGGKSTSEAVNLIAHQLEDKGFVSSPQLTLTVTQFASQQVSIIGQVNKPGMYALEKSSRLSEMLALAGGIGPEGGDKAILLRTVAEGGKSKRIEIDLEELFAGNLVKDISVAAGDVISVPKAPVFYIYGEVQHPGMFRLQRNMTVAQAISIGGGLTPKGTENRLKIKRRTALGETETYDVQLDDSVKPDEVVYVSESWF